MTPQGPKDRRIIGLMSGTSMDAVDACCVDLGLREGHFHYEILATATRVMPTGLKRRLKGVANTQEVTLPELCALNHEMGMLFAQTVQDVLKAGKLEAKEVDAIGSHGQTIYHQSPEAQKPGGTFQLGDPAIIAQETGILTISDFRARDMAVGGQGAPLVCLADHWLFQDPTICRCIQNIGGIANVTVLPPGIPSLFLKSETKPALNRVSAPISNDPIAFDMGPGNMLIDEAMQQLFDLPMDDSGRIAQSGSIEASLLAHLMDHPYLALPIPKTTGRKVFGSKFLQETLAAFPDVSPRNIVTTLTEYTAKSIVQAYQQFVFPNYSVKTVIVGGGGVYNKTLMTRLSAHFQTAAPHLTVKTHQDFGISDTYKEALAFTFLAWANCQHLPGNIPSCTGAQHPVVLGNITPGNPEKYSSQGEESKAYKQTRT